MKDNSKAFALSLVVVAMTVFLLLAGISFWAVFLGGGVAPAMVSILAVAVATMCARIALQIHSGE